MKFILVIWFITPTNFAEYDSFNSLNECISKLQTVEKALTQAQSTMKAECRKVENVKA